jgi:hypothetical protein
MVSLTTSKLALLISTFAGKSKSYKVIMAVTVETVLSSTEFGVLNLAAVHAQYQTNTDYRLNKYKAKF